ncbi:MAG: hypothetical protein GYB66_04955 [Chloroflexi bacterium]|nr:hypothetical protein [Chloroflexota bacterium]
MVLRCVMVICFALVPLSGRPGNCDGQVGELTTISLPTSLPKISSDNFTELQNLATFEIQDAIADVAWSRDGTWFVAGGFRFSHSPEGFYVFYVNSESITLLHNASTSVRALEFSPIDDTVFVATANEIRRYELLELHSETIVAMTVLSPHSNVFTAMGVSPDGSMLATGTDPESEISIWNAETGILVDQLPDLLSISSSPYAHGISALEYHPIHDLLAIGQLLESDHVVYMWNITTGELSRLTSLSQDTRLSEVAALSFSPSQDLLASGGYDGRVKLWSLHELSEIQLAGDYQDPGCVSGLDFSPDGTMLISNAASKADIQHPTDHVVFWSIPDAELLGTVTIPATQYPRFAFSPDGTLIAISFPRSIQFWGVVETP